MVLVSQEMEDEKLLRLTLKTFKAIRSCGLSELDT